MKRRLTTTRRTLTAAIVAGLTCAFVATGTSSATAQTNDTATTDKSTAAALALHRSGWAADTWKSMKAMVVPSTGLPADNIEGDLDPAGRSAYTSPTNVASYLWSTVSARELGLISREEARARMRTTLDSVATLERHEPSGMFYNWYDPATGDVLHIWPSTGQPIDIFLSSVDNAWMATGLMIVKNAEPSLRDQAQALLDTMDFAFYYDEVARGADVPTGLMRGGFWVTEPPGCSIKGNYQSRGEDVYYTCHTYGAFASESRMVSYVAISLGQVPTSHYFGPWRTFPDNCDWGWQEMKPVGEWKTYMDVPVFEGAYRYQGLQFVPTWGGDMFEALMPDLFVPETKWGKNSWARNHPAYVQGQIRHGLSDAKYGHWGFSPASDPFAEYREYGVDAMGLDTDGYTSDKERTSVDFGFEGCRDAKPAPASYGDGVVTPHAIFMAMQYAPVQSVVELFKLRKQFDIYGPGGFYDSVAVRSGTVAKRYLALDQGMIMASLGNMFGNDVLRRAFTKGGADQLLRPAMELEEFTVPARQS